MLNSPSTPQPVRVLFISLEFLGPLFSGNGTYSRSIIKSLTQQYYPSTTIPCFRFCIVSGMPILPASSPVSTSSSDTLSSSATPNPSTIPPEAYLPSTDTSYRHSKIWDPDIHYLMGEYTTNTNAPSSTFSSSSSAVSSAVSSTSSSSCSSSTSPHQIIGVPLPSWGKLHRHSSWKEFGTLVASSLSIHQTLSSFAPQLIMYVDWTGYTVYQILRDTYSSTLFPDTLPTVYLNFRIFTSSVALHEPLKVRKTSTSTDTSVIDAATQSVATTLSSSPSLSSPDAGSVTSSILYDNEYEENDMSFYQRMEILALYASRITVCLCRTDYCHLNALYYFINPVTYRPIDFSYHPAYDRIYLSLLHRQKRYTYQAYTVNYADIRIVLPPLRSDIYDLAVNHKNAVVPWTANLHRATNMKDFDTQERLLTSVVRLSPEKGTLFFSQLIDALQTKSSAVDDTESSSSVSSVLLRYRIRALLCGSAPDLAYAQLVRSTLLSARRLPVQPVSDDTQSIIDQENERIILISSFLNGHDMAAIYARSLINVHSALADAYGMTIVEAAAFGVPSIIHIPSSVALERVEHYQHYPSELVSALLRMDIPSFFTVQPSHDPPNPLLGYLVFTLPLYLDKLIGLYASSSLSPSIASDAFYSPATTTESSPRALTILLGTTFVTFSSTLPAIGACDLLGAPRITFSTDEQTPNRTDDGDTVTHSSGILPMDLTLPPTVLADRLLRWIHQDFTYMSSISSSSPSGLMQSSPKDNQNDKDSFDTVPYLQRIKRVAQKRALGWQEKHNGEALASIMHELVQ